MSKTTTIRVVAGGTPQSGVQACASEIDPQWHTTDENGEISAQFEDDQVFCGRVAVKLVSGAIYGIDLVLEAGDTKEVFVPSA